MTGRWSGSLLTCMTTSTGAWRPLVRVSDIQAPREMPSENVWLDLLNTYLPKRYQAAKAHVVDSNGTFSDQIDVVVYDRQYSPFIFRYEEQTIIPAESVYAVFEAKQTLNKEHIEYAREKVASVRRLHRTSLPIPHAGGTYPPKPAHSHMWWSVDPRERLESRHGRVIVHSARRWHGE